METLQKNQIHTAQITGYASDGAGVCRICGRAVFVKGTIPGELWEVRILKVTASAVYGRGEKCLSPSPARQEPPCPVYRKCGGCSLLHMTYAEELRQYYVVDENGADKNQNVFHSLLFLQFVYNSNEIAQCDKGAWGKNKEQDVIMLGNEGPTKDGT